MFKKSNFIFPLLFLTVSFWLIYLYKKDIDFGNRWSIFYSWLILFFSSVIYFFYRYFDYCEPIKSFLKKNCKQIVFVVFLSIFTRFLFLSDYPYAVFGDFIRDAGSNGQAVRSGAIKDLFGFGNYNGYGNFVPLISSYFSFLWKNSNLMIKIPSAMAGSLSLMLLFLLCLKIYGTKIAWASFMVMCFSFVHLHFSRTEPVILYDSLLSLLIISVTYLSLITPKAFFLTGLVLGFSLHFYIGIIGIVLASIICLITKSYINIFEKKENSIWNNIKTTTANFLLFTIGLIIALGPSLSNYRLFINAAHQKIDGRSLLFTQSSPVEKITEFYKNFQKSFFVYFYEPTAGVHFNYKNSLLTFPFNWFFLFGILFLCIKNKKRAIDYLLLYYLLFITITNQVLPNNIGFEYRLLSLVPILSIISANGFATIFEKFFYNKKILFFVILGIISLYQFSIYFIGRLSDIGLEKKEYLLQAVAEYIKNNPAENYYLLNPNEADINFDTLHHREKLNFYSFPKEVKIFINKNQILTETENIMKQNMKVSVIVFNESDFNKIDLGKKEIILDCSKRNLFNFHCPLGYLGKDKFYVLNN